MILGIDEAGRGPVIGPMVMAGVILEEKASSALRDFGVKDSKLVPAEKREKLYALITEVAIAYKIMVIEPSAIDEAILKSNINWLEARTSAEIINILKPKTAIVDCPSPNISAYTDYLRKKLSDKTVNLILEHKAERHMPVAAASILAKVTRDRIIENLKSQIGIDFGSGYLTDEKTQRFLSQYHDTFKHIFRNNWAPYKDIMDKKLQMHLSKFTTSAR